MLKSFFTLLHYKARFFFTQLKNGCYRTGQPNKSSSSNLVVSSFVDMGMSSQFKQVFKLIDTNGDGKISATELSELLSCLGYRNSIAAKEAEGMVSLLDSNGDGFVDLDEFMVAVNDKEGKFGSDNKEEDEYLMDAFLIFDIDKNGLISAQELKRVLVNLGFGHCSIKECKLMIKTVDKNGDGFVDFEEFRSMMKSGIAN